MVGVNFPPLNVRMAFKNDGSAGARFRAAVDEMTTTAKSQFRQAGTEIERMLDKSTSGLKGGALTFDVSGLRQSAAEAGNALQRITAMRDAAISLAKSTGDTSIETQRYVQALRAETAEAERAKVAADAQVTTYTRLQSEIDRTVASQARLEQAYRATYLEQARAENAAHAAQQRTNSVISDALSGNRAIDRGAGSGALDEMVRMAEQAERLRHSIDPAAVAQARFNLEMGQARTLISAGAITLDEYCAKLRIERGLLDQASAAGQRHAATTGAQRAGMQQLSMQIGDISTMYALGASSQQIFASQASQVIQAVSLMGGGTSKFASFMMGPWGTALTAGALVITPFLSKILDSEKGMKAAALAADGLSDAQNVMGQMFDLTTGKIKNQNDMLRLNIQLTAMNLRAEAMRARSTAEAAAIAAGRPDMLTSVGEMLAQGAGAAPRPTTAPPKTVARSMIEDVLSGRMQGSAAQKWAETADFSNSGISQQDFIAAIIAGTEARAKGVTADEITKTLETGKLSDMFRREAPQRKGRSGADEARKIAEWGESAAEKVARITEQFDRQPRAIDRVQQATRELDRIYKGLEERTLLTPETLKAIDGARAAIGDFETRPFREMVEAAREQSEIQGLVLQGREVEAEILSRALSLQRDQGKVTTDQIATVRALVLAQREQTAELAKQNALREREARLVDDTAGNLRQSMSEIARGGGIGSVGDLFKRQFALVRESALDNLFDSVFGEFFSDQKGKALGFDKVKEASRDQATVAGELTDTLRRLDQAAGDLTSRLSADPTATFSTAQPGSLQALFDQALGRPTMGSIIAPASGNVTANDNDGTAITVTGRKSRREFIEDSVARVADVFLDARTARKIGEGFADGISGGQGAAAGMMASGLIFGGGSSQIGSAIGGGIGEKLLTKPLEKGLESLAKGLGQFAGPLAGIAGGLIGGALGGALKSTPRASATIGGGASGSFEVVSIRGNSESRRRASEQSAGEAIDSLDRIAEALGASIDASRGTVSIGVRKGDYRVDTSGQGVTKTSKGAIDFGEDSAAAIKYATMDLIRDGVLTGLRQGTQTLLQNAKDLEAGLAKAVDFQSIFDRLKAFDDPVGAAIDGVDKEFVRLRNIAIEAGEGLVEVERLYGIERAAAVKAAMESATGSIKGLLDELTMGDSGLSLRARRDEAMSRYQPIADRVRAGDATAYDEFAEISQTLLGISREIDGSQQGYFDLFNEVRALSQSTLDAEVAKANAAIARDTPFSNSAVPAYDNSGVVNAINQQTAELTGILSTQLSAVNGNLAQLIRQAANSNSSNPWANLGLTGSW